MLDIKTETPRTQTAELLTHLSIFWKENIDCFAAGGACVSAYLGELDLKKQDIDLYFPNAYALEQALSLLYRLHAVVVFETDNATNLKIGEVTYGINSRKYGTPEEVLERFDFYGCMFYAHSLYGGELKASRKEAEAAARGKRLYPNPAAYDTQSAYGWVVRTAKYKRKGWNMRKGDAERLVKEYGSEMLEAVAVYGLCKSENPEY